MKFYIIMSIIIMLSGCISAFFFRKGAIYNPEEPLPDPDLDVIPIPMETPDQEAPAAPQSMLVRFCTAIRDYEGKPGDLNYQLNNPGDCRPSPVGYLPKYEPVEIINTNTDPRYPYHIGKFAKFPTYALGWEYLQNMVHTMATNHPDWTIKDFFVHFAPSGDKNDPGLYAKHVAATCGVPVDKKLRDLFG